MEMAYNEYINEYYAKIGEAGRRGAAQALGGGGGRARLRNPGRPRLSPGPAAPQASLTR